MARLRYNGLRAELAGSGLTDVATAVTFAAALTHSNGTNVPTITGSDYIPLAILDTSGHLSEIVWLTAYTAAATTGTIVRGKEGTTGVAHSSGDAVAGAIFVADVETIRDRRWVSPSSMTSIDEFNDDSLDGAWTRVDGTGAASGLAAWTEASDSLNVYDSGAETGSAFHALVRPVGTSMSTGDAFVTAVRMSGQPRTNYSISGLVLTDGTTHGAGKQLTGRTMLSASGFTVDTVAFTNFNTVAAASATALGVPGGFAFVRVVLTAANTWRTDTSPDGVTWRAGATVSYTMTPTHVGFWSTGNATSLPFVVSFDFLRRVSGVS